jgi:hypothetical protein
MARITLGVLAAMMLLAAPANAVPNLNVYPVRDHEAIVLTGKDFPAWAVPSNTTARLPLMDVVECGPENMADTDACEHNHYAEPDADTAPLQPAGAAVDHLLAYRWVSKTGGGSFVQIPFQVDEQFTRYLNNEASGFSVYSGEDQHTTYAYDREGFRWTDSDPANPCLARPASPVATDPIAGLDYNDELVFMARDAGPEAPSYAKLPAGVTDFRKVQVVDPAALSSKKYVYVALAGADGPKPAFDASNGYVSYQRDANSDTFEKSESSYDNYGNAARGVVCDKDGNVVGTSERRRPRDFATITTDRYRFRYDGRWLMTKVEISPNDDGETFGPDLVDRWKARAFQQDPSSETPTGAAPRRCSASASARSAPCARPGAPTPARTSSAARPSTASRWSSAPGCACT